MGHPPAKDTSPLAMTPRDLGGGGTSLVLHGSLIVDLDGSVNQMRDESFFGSETYWLVSNVEEASTALSFLRFDSQVYSVEDKRVYEWYQVNTTVGEPRVVKAKVGALDSAGGLKMNNMIIWERRSLHGATLKITHIPTVGLYKNVHDGSPGFFPRLVRKMEEMSNFSSLWVLPKDGEAGRLKSNGEW